MLYTTLNKIKEYGPCSEGWKLLLENVGKTQADNEPLSLEDIYNSNGFLDTVWVLIAVEGLPNKALALLAIRFAEIVLPVFEEVYSEDKRPRKALETAKNYLANKTAEDKIIFASAAMPAARAASDAAEAARWGASAAAEAAWWTAGEAARWAASAARNAAENRPDLRHALEAELLKFIQEGHEYV